VSVKEHEWLEVGAWVHKHFDSVTGITFLPHSDHSYRQAPYEECTKEEYESLVNATPTSIDWGKLSEYEQGDQTVAMQLLACTAGVCELAA
jgi:ribonucleoside-diphosphate reductase alpha chain